MFYFTRWCRCSQVMVVTHGTLSSKRPNLKTRKIVKHTAHDSFLNLRRKSLGQDTLFNENYKLQLVQNRSKGYFYTKQKRNFSLMIITYLHFLPTNRGFVLFFTTKFNNRMISALNRTELISNIAPFQYKCAKNKNPHKNLL